MHLQPHVHRGAAVQPCLHRGAARAGFFGCAIHAARLITASLGLALLASCGGGHSDTPSPAQQLRQVADQAAQSAARQRATQPLAASTSPLTPDQLMDWAETTLPTLFPGHVATAAGLSYSYRYYAASGNTLGVGFDGTVYVLMGASATLLNLGPLANFTCLASTACQQSTIALLAGSTGGMGYVDGAGPQARFNSPAGMAFDRNGTLYVADRSNNAIRRVSAQGVTSTLAGNPNEPAGFANGSGTTARFSAPMSVAVGPQGEVYVLDSGNKALRVVTPAGVVSTLASNLGDLLSSLAVDGAGNVYLAAGGSILRVAANGAANTWTGSRFDQGYADGSVASARFTYITALATDAAGNVYASDNGTLRRITPGGTVTTLGGVNGQMNGLDGPLATYGRLLSSSSLAVSPDGSMAYMLTTNTVRRVTATDVTTIAGSYIQGANDGPGAAASFRSLQGMALDAAGNLFVSDVYNANIRRISPGGNVTTLAGPSGTTGSVDGPGSSARFSSPIAVAVDKAGYTYVADQYNHTIRKIAPDGTTATLAGDATGTGGDARDGLGTNARFGWPAALAIDAGGTLYVADTNAIRKISPTGVVSTLAGSLQGESGLVDGQGTSARFNQPRGLALDAAGNLYVSDLFNQAVRKVTPSGQVSTLFRGTTAADYSADLMMPLGLALDGAGNVYVADMGNLAVLKITPGGQLSTLAGRRVYPSSSVDGEGLSARFIGPYGVTTDGQGNLYVTDVSFAPGVGNFSAATSFTVRKVALSGATVTTVAGQPYKTGLTLGATPGLLRSLTGIAWANGKLVVVSDQAILTISPAP